ncbi:MAG: translation initiation factor IF-2 [Candidatus Iainarchaeum archaeon]|uniref:Probable translation initiation factor IF-2 n=1 Tax=Candidatus Iainarchaeum sp. TaxID=3101447 RepID=A0A497JIK9_9ARCH|nr:MAG: translation initiation factor IF-2 [Candidatus Diapherotrites archaeon]
MIRQPIIAVLGHVDHGKTLFLDKIRGTTIAEREAGRITQHIGATEVPAKIIEKISSKLLKKFGFELKIPGLLFIDTPGHEAFTNLRKRGGSVADLAVLVIDITQGVQAQTKEAIEILKSYKTPFVVAATKIDALHYWDSKKGSFLENMKEQSPQALQQLDEKIYEIVGKLYEFGFQSDRFDRCTDFTKQIAIVPVSNITGEGIPEILMLLTGLSQKFLSNRLEITEEEEPKGTVLEVREEKGLGMTIDVILYAGKLRINDEVLVGGKNGIIKTKIRALLKPEPLSEIRDKKSAFVNVSEVSAACGVKIAAPGLDDALAGSPVVLAKSKDAKGQIERELKAIRVKGKTGIIIKADALGSLEALTQLFKSQGIKVREADVGDITRKDIIEACSVKRANPLEGVVVGFNVGIEEHASIEAKKLNIKIFRGNVIYKLIEDYKEWRAQEQERLKREREKKLVWPAKFIVLPQYIFRNSNPAVIGVRILVGKVRPNMKVLNSQGKIVGKVVSIQSQGKELDEACANEEVAVSIDKGVVGRNIKLNETFYSYIPKKQFNDVLTLDLNEEERGLLEEIKSIEQKIEEEKVVE